MIGKLLTLQVGPIVEVMKKFTVKVLFPTLLLSVLAASCDFVRSVAGRPSSEEVSKMKVEKEKQEEIRKQEAAQLRLKQKNEDALSSIAKLGVTIKKSSEIKSGLIEDIPAGYYVMLGAFSKEANAAKLSEQAVTAGFEAVIITYGNGQKAVGVFAGTTPAELLDRYLNVAKESFCPLEAWILEKE